MKKYIGLVLGLLIAVSPHTVSASEADLQKRLLKAMQIQDNGKDRQAQARPIVRDLVKAGYLKKRQLRLDYADYHFTGKPFNLLGLKLVLLQEEYMDKYAGCCVNPGLRLFFEVNADTRAIEEFASKNACHLDLHDDLLASLKNYEIEHKLPKADYASLSCRENDTRW